MKNQILIAKLAGAESLDEVEGLLKGCPGIDAGRVWEEVQKHRSIESEKLDMAELDAVSGGADRDWKRNGCAATCEWDSWCWSNDSCMVWDVTYDNFWVCCPDGHDHVYEGTRFCVRCGYKKPGGDFSEN